MAALGHRDDSDRRRDPLEHRLVRTPRIRRARQQHERGTVETAGPIAESYGHAFVVREPGPSRSHVAREPIGGFEPTSPVPTRKGTIQ
jgi:hypothetical protein